MPDDLLLAGAVFLNIVGFGWLALAMDGHWKHVCGTGGSPAQRRSRLRLAATATFLTSFVLCNLSDHATIAVLVWVMSLTAAALLVACTLTWRPRLLRALVWRGDDMSTRAEP